VELNHTLDGEHFFLEAHEAVGKGAIVLILLIAISLLLEFVVKAKDHIHVLYYSNENPKRIFFIRNSQQPL
jgi:hypothetical protein